MNIGAADSPELEIQLFGPFKVCVNGIPVDEARWGRRSAKALIKLLSMSPPHALHREQLVEQLWPDLGADAGMNSLNKAIHAARRALEPTLARGAQSRFIRTPTNQVMLSAPGGLRVDIHLFEQAAQQAMREQDVRAAREALGLYRGALLIDDLYEPWTFARREWSRLMFRSTSMAAARMLAPLGETVQAAAIAQRLLLDDPTDEPVHELLMALHRAAGRPDQALRQFESARRALEAAGLAPGPSLVALHQAIQQQETTAPAQPAWMVDLTAGALQPDPRSVRLTPVSFQSGTIRTARALPGGGSQGGPKGGLSVGPEGGQVLVEADWDGGRMGVHRLDLATGQSEPLPWADAGLLGVSAQGDVALRLNRRFFNAWIDAGTLAILPAGGSEPIELLQGVHGADWYPDSERVVGASANDEPVSAEAWAQRLAVVREVRGKVWVECPVGTPRHLSAGWVSHLRCSPCGRWLAFVEHPVENDDAGDVIVLDLQVSSTGVYAGTGIGLRALASGFTSVQGLAWAGGRVWFTASPTSMRRALWCADPRSQARRVHQESGPLKVHDAVNDQSLLITTDRPMLNLLARASGEANERDITWHALTWPRDISPDGRWLLVEEIDPVGNAGYTAFLRSIDGRVTRKLVDGVPLAFSPDGQRALVRLSQGGGRLALVDLAGGALTPLPVDDTQHLACSEFACFFPDGERIAFMARDDSGGVRLCTQDLSGGLPERLLPEASGVRLMSNRAISPDGRTIALQGDDDFVHLCPVDEGTPRPLATLGPGYFLIGWHSDGESVFAYPFNAEPPRVERLNLATGALSPWKVFSPEGSGPASSPRRFRMTPDGSAHVYALERVLSDLYVLQEEAAGSQGQGAHPPR